jgi:diguanylate cyclase (GGDEF)-like protein
MGSFHSFIKSPDSLFRFRNEYLFHPTHVMKREEYLWSAIIMETLFFVGISLMITITILLLTPQMNFVQGIVLAIGLPLLVVPPLGYSHHKLIFELESSRRKIEEFSRIDGLTGLLNRRYFFEKIEENMALAKRYGYPISVLLIDLDHFKSVNDSFGHQTGDEVLRAIAACMSKVKRGTDIMARYGGEEFVILMPQTGGEKVLNLDRRLRQRLVDDQANSHGKFPPVTFSSGAACSDQHGYDFDRLLKEADLALYQAKAKGRDTFVLSGSEPSGSELTDS